MRDNRDYDFSALSERISAQTEAYVEFSNALVKIIEQTASIRDKVSETNSHLLDDYRNLNTKFQELLIEFNKFASENKNDHLNFNKDLGALKNKFTSYEVQLNDMIKEMDAKNSKFFKIFDEIESKNTHTNKLINDNHEELTNIISDMHKKVSTIEGFLSKVANYFHVILAILGLIGMLMGFKILDIRWFN